MPENMTKYNLKHIKNMMKTIWAYLGSGYLPIFPEEERRKNNDCPDLKKETETQDTNETTMNATKADNTRACPLDPTNDDILSGLKVNVEKLKFEDGNILKDASVTVIDGIEDVSFDFLDCTMNTTNALTSTRLSINKKRRESRRQTIFGLLEENTTFKKQLRIEQRRSVHTQKEPALLEDKVKDISLGEDTYNEETGMTCFNYFRLKI